MRIIAGKLKGTILHLPKDKNTRPLKDLVRESIFNLLNHSNKISIKLENSNILDLYAGTGSFGLECLSRQANSVCFVEKKKDAIEILEKNIKKLRVKKKEVICVCSGYSLDFISLIFASYLNDNTITFADSLRKCIGVCTIMGKGWQ